MTAEVAIANGGAVALAADSAVTIGGQKIYNSALKLFTLSKTEPVGIMIYGNANLLDVPWETLIKLFRTNQGDTSYPTLDEYATNFLRFIESKNNCFATNIQEQWFLGNVKSYFSILREEMLNKTHPIFEKDGQIDSHTTDNIISEVILKHHKLLKEKPFSGTMTSSFESKIRKKYLLKVKELIVDVFQNTNINKGLSSKLYDIATYLLTRDIFPNGTSGIVVAGFGDDEIYPVITTFEVAGIFDGKLKYKPIKGKSERISSGMGCSIIAFAQDDMVHSFMSGINPSILNMLDVYLNKVFDRLPELLSNSQLSKEEHDTFCQDSKDLLTELFDQLNSHMQEKHINPVLGMVKVLPKDELAAMAEALVNLTAFKRKMTDSIETVGGPIDVAVISKGDGFIWVKRKHYFPADLNQHFFSNYFRGVQNDSESES